MRNHMGVAVGYKPRLELLDRTVLGALNGENIMAVHQVGVGRHAALQDHVPRA